jgi:hypothetical protein
MIHNIEWSRYSKLEYGTALRAIPVGDSVELPWKAPGNERYLRVPVIKPLSMPVPNDDAIFTDETEILLFERMSGHGIPDLWKRIA